MKRKKLLINIEIYIYYARRVKVYAPGVLHFLYKLNTLSKDQYLDYIYTLQVVAKTVEDMGFENKVKFHVRHWLLWFLRPFLKGAFRSPVIIIGGEVVSVGRVPDKTLIKEMITKADRKYKFLEKK